MAKSDKKADTKGKKAKTEDKEEAETFKYGVQDIADKLELEPASVRVKLRNAGVEKAGKAYGWNTKAELQEVIDEISSEKPAKKDKDSNKKPSSKKKAKDEDDDDDEDEAPKKASKSKGAKKGSSKKKSKSDDDDDDDDD